MAELGEVLVTGASGYIGAHVVNECLKEGYTVRATVRDVNNAKKVDPLKKMAKDKPGVLKIVELDVVKPETCISNIKGCTYVIHTAAVLDATNEESQHTTDVNFQGSKNILDACAESGTVKRFIFTSTVTAVGVTPSPRKLNEDDWNEIKPGSVGSFAYPKSKTLAEKYVWDYAAKLPDDKKFEVVSILPSFVMGPPLTTQNSFSLNVIKRYMAPDPMIPKMSLSFVDVLDVAKAHLLALTQPNLAGQRVIIDDKPWSYLEVRTFLNKEFNQHGYHLSTRVMPLWLYKLMIFFNIEPEAKMTVHLWGTSLEYDNTKMQTVLGIKPRDSKKAMIDMVYELIDIGYIEKKREYKGRPSSQID